MAEKKLPTSIFMVTVAVMLCSTLFSAHTAYAATLSVSPSTGTVAVGNIITLDVVVNAAGQAINNSDAIIQFPTDLLDVISVSKSGSIFTLWVEDPSFSNAAGQVLFNGGITNPGYQGNRGELVSITFRAKKAGTASILFSDAAVRANDGLGTDVLTAKNGAILTIAAQKPIVVPPVVPTIAPSSPSSKADTVAPRNLKVQTALDDQGRVIVHMSATDALSSISHYSVQVDQGQVVVVAPSEDGNATTTLAALSGGNHTLLVEVFDRSGNMAQVVQNLTASVSAINVTSYPLSISVGEKIILTGHVSYPNAVVIVSLTTDGTAIATHKIVADTDGVFHFESDAQAVSGIATVWADLLNQDGRVIASTEKLSITIAQPLLIQIGSYSTGLLSVLVPLGALLFLLFFLTYLGWNKFLHTRSRLKKDLDQTKMRVHQAFKTLSEEASDQLATIEQSAKHRKLSPAEEKAIEDLHTAINTVDTYIQNLVEKIEDTDL